MPITMDEKPREKADQKSLGGIFVKMSLMIGFQAAVQPQIRLGVKPGG